MNSRKNLAAQVAGAMAIVALVGTSAFAETRHRDATERDRSERSGGRVHRDGNRQSDQNTSDQNQTQVRREPSTTAPQTFERRDSRNNSGTWNRNEARNNNNGTSSRNELRNNNNGTWNRNESRNNGSFNNRSQAESYRNNNRSQSYRNSRPAYDDHGRRSMSYGGRISRFAHERGGYRIWVDGGRYPIWIPEARISLFPRLRIGLSLNFGGYYDPRGYLDAYDYYDAGYGTRSSGLLRGVVETVDYRRGTLVLRDDVSGSFVTTIIRDRRLETLRPGDYAEIAGDWTRSGVFEGLRLEDVQSGRY